MKKKKKPVFLGLFGLLGVCVIFAGIAFFLHDGRMHSVMEESKKLAVRSFQILGLDGKGKNPRDKVKKVEEGLSRAEWEIFRVGEERARYPEYMFYLLALRKRFELRLGDEIWGEKVEKGEVLDLVKEEVVKEMIQLKLMLQKAKQEGITLTEAEKKEIMASANEQFLQIEPLLIAKYYLTTDLIARVYEENFLADKYVRNYEKQRNLVGKDEMREELLTRVYHKMVEENEIEIFYQNLKEIEF